MKTNAKTIDYKGQTCTAHRVDVYVKRGAYSHGYVKGWELRNAEGSVVVNPEPLRCASAYEYQTARFTTLASLKNWVEGENEHDAAMAKRKLLRQTNHELLNMPVKTGEE